MRRGDMTIEIKTPEQFGVMREAGLVVARTLRILAEAVRPGVTTADLDALAEAEIRAAGATPSFKGYHGYPATICASVNSEIVHGIPSRERSLREGDIVSIDCGAIVRGWHGDAAVTVGVGAISAEHADLLQACETALWRGIAQARAGGRLSVTSRTRWRPAWAPRVLTAWSQEYTGHGIGSAMHMDPPVPNYGRPGRGPRLRAGMALAIEPMVMLGSAETVLLEDGWTVVTADGSWAAHFEHTVAITPDGPWVLTALPAGGTTPQDPAGRGDDPPKTPPAPLWGDHPPRPLGGNHPPRPPWGGQGPRLPVGGGIAPQTPWGGQGPRPPVGAGHNVGGLGDTRRRDAASIPPT